MVNGDHDNSKSKGSLVSRCIFWFLKYLHVWLTYFFRIREIELNSIKTELNRIGLRELNWTETELNWTALN